MQYSSVLSAMQFHMLCSTHSGFHPHSCVQCASCCLQWALCCVLCMCSTACCALYNVQCSLQCCLQYVVCFMQCAALFTRCGRHFHRGLLAFSPHQRSKPSPWCCRQISWITIMTDYDDDDLVADYHCCTDSKNFLGVLICFMLQLCHICDCICAQNIALYVESSSSRSR